MIIYFNKLFYSLIHWVSILFLVLCGGVEGKKENALFVCRKLTVGIHFFLGALSQLK